MIDVEQTIISQYGNSATITQLIQNMNTYIDPRADFDKFYDYVWNVETAEGFGLDIWGRIVGVERIINIQEDTPNPGYYTFTSGAYVMPDNEYRVLILIKALANITDCSARSINQLLSNLFASRGRCYVLDLGGMSLRYTFEFYLKPFEYVIIMSLDLAPRPAGVLINILQVDPNQVFGFAEGIQFQPFDQGVFYKAI